MISMRYHIVSLAAVFLALALGIVLGATKINSPLLAGLKSDNSELSTVREGLAEENAALTDRIATDGRFADTVGPLAVRDWLSDQPVVLVTTDTADPTDRDAILTLLDYSGAIVTAQVKLTSDFSDPQRADQLRSLVIANLPVGAHLPESPNAGTIAGGLLSTLLLTDDDGQAQASPEEATAALAALDSAGFISASGDIAPGRLVMVLTGPARVGEAAASRAQVITDFALAIGKSSAGVVLAGRSGAEGTTGSVGLTRSDTAASARVSTVDNAETDAGRVAAVLALVEQFGGGVGRYGYGENAQAPAPIIAWQ